MKQELQLFLKDAVEEGVFPGCVCAIVTDKQVDYYCEGFKSIYPIKQEIHLNTLYDIASLSKVVATTPMILKLIQTSKLTYQTKVNEIIPEFKNDKITILDLLTHTSGLKADLGWPLGTSEQEMFNDVCSYARLVVPHGEVIYSDIGYMILGWIIEKITYQSLDQTIKEEIFIPLNMTHSYYRLNESLKKQVAPTEISSYTHQLIQGTVHDRKAQNCNGIAGHAGVFTNIYDLVNYTQMILDDGKFNHQVFLEERYIKDMFQCWTSEGQIPRGIGYLTYDSTGIFSKYHSHYTIGHTGFTGTSLFIDKENRIGIILLSNRIHVSRTNNKIITWRKLFHDKVMETYCVK